MLLLNMSIGLAAKFSLFFKDILLKKKKQRDLSCPANTFQLIDPHDEALHYLFVEFYIFISQLLRFGIYFL